MKCLKLIPIFLTLALFVSFCAGAKKVSKEEATTVSGILQNAGCPLTGEQAKQLKEFKPGGDPGAFRTMFELFDEKQTDALKKVFGSSPGREGGPERPRFLFFAIMFENQGCPFTVEQLDKIKALPSDRGAFEQMQEIFTEKQNEIMQSMFNR